MEAREGSSSSVDGHEMPPEEVTFNQDPEDEEGLRTPALKVAYSNTLGDSSR